VITEEDIAAQALVFYIAGFDTVATMLSFLAHELAVNPEIQERLRAEIDATISTNKGKLTYESIISMKYLDMVTSGQYIIISYLHN
jgi:cytochrome P450 family 9